MGTSTQFTNGQSFGRCPKKTACFTLASWTVRAIVTLFAARCAYVFRTFKVRRRLVRSITTCRTRSRWASLFIMTNFFAECTDCAQYLGAVVLIVPFWIQRACASRTLVFRACEAARVSMVRAAACFASWITFARGMAGFTACVAHSVRTRASFQGARRGQPSGRAETGLVPRCGSNMQRRRPGRTIQVGSAAHCLVINVRCPEPSTSRCRRVHGEHSGAGT